ncbi:MAG: VOC family protein [Opitutaceae bacterium]|nr:VOC family protein [Opitutaceae bacterium]
MPTKRHLAAVLSLAVLTAATVLPAAPTIPPLVDPPTKHLVPGRFVWGDLFTTDPAASIQFYAGLFGWTPRTIESEGTAYTLLSQGTVPVCGIVKGPATPDNAPAARWIGYISVKDIDKAAKAAVAKKGRIVIAPRQVPDRGLHAILADNEGALFGLMTSSSGDPADHLAEPNQWMWISLFAREPRNVLPLYRAVAGWQEHDDYRTANPDDYVLSAGGYARAGMSKIQADSKAPPSWVGFVRVTNVKEATQRAVDLGGRAIADARTITSGNELSIISDPLGATFGLAAFLEESEAK